MTRLGAIVAAQIDAVLSDLSVQSIKLGVLFSPQIIQAVASALSAFRGAVVVDPVMIAKSGDALLQEDAVAALIADILPRADLLTPNLPELEILAGHSLSDTGAIIEAALDIAKAYDCHVLAKGGHTQDARVIDILVGPEGFLMQFDDARIDTRHTHGTGCTLSSAIATLVGHGQPMHHAIRLGRQFTRAAIENAPGLGDGNGPLGHQAVRRLEA